MVLAELRIAKALVSLFDVAQSIPAEDSLLPVSLLRAKESARFRQIAGRQGRYRLE